jgi:fructose-1,6-bisphosphatase/inositol monophosphatase family enzyme
VDRLLRDELRTLLADAGAEALARFRRVVPEWKADGTPVTEADRAVEAILVERLSRAFPGDHVRSEEGTRVEGRPGAPVWFVDPIDGTGSYVAGLPDWGPTVCRVVDGVLTVGAFLAPRVGEHWHAEVGGGAWRGEERLPPMVDRAVRGDDLLFLPSRFHRRGPIPWRGKVRALGSSAMHLCHVASGAGVAAIVPKWSLWDVGAGALLIREVGGEVRGADGEPLAPERSVEGLPLLVGAPTALRSLFADGWAAGALGAPGNVGKAG